MNREELEAMTVPELQDYAIEHEIEISGSLRKAEIVDAILSATSDAPGDAEADEADDTIASDEPEEDGEAEAQDGLFLSVGNAPIVIGHAAYHFDGPIRKVVARSGRVDVHFANGDREEILNSPGYDDADAFQRQYEERFGVKLEPRGS